MIKLKKTLIKRKKRRERTVKESSTKADQEEGVKSKRNLFL